MAVTHFYGILGDGHVRGKRSPAPLMIDPLAGQQLQYLAQTQDPVLNTVVRGATTGAAGRVTNAQNASAGTVIIELWTPTTPFRPGETLNFDTGGTATCSIILDPTLHPLTQQFALQHGDAELNSAVPADLVSDAPVWDRNAKTAQEITLASGFTGAFSKGDRVTTSGGGAFTVQLSSAGAGGTLVLKIIRKTGSIAAAQTVTNTTQAGSGTISAVVADPPQGAWVPFTTLPNLNGAGTFYEFLPNGCGGDGKECSLGPAITLLRRAYDKNVANTEAADKGTRLFVHSTFDDVAADATLGGVTVQVVKCSGTFPTNWTLGETVTAGSWSAKLRGFNATSKYLFVTGTNGQVLAAGTVTGGTSGATATSTGAAIGYQKGSTYFTQFVAAKATALAASGALYSGSAARWDGLLLMPWEGELATFAPNACPLQLEETFLQAWTQFIADLRTELGRADLPIALFQMLASSHAEINFGGITMASVLRAVMDRLTTMIDNVALATTEGLQPYQTTGVPYTSNALWLRTDDYLEVGYRAWRAIEFASYTIPNSDFAPLPVGITIGVSHLVNSISGPALMAIDRDPDLYPSATFPGISTLDPKVLMWNAKDNVQQWEPLDISQNGNTFFGMTGFSGVVAAMLHRMKRRYSTGAGSAEVGVIHLAVNGSSFNAAAVGAPGTWDTNGSNRAIVTASLTCTAIAATGQDPQLGRFTGTAGQFAAFVVGQYTTVSGSGLGFLGAGGNNHVPYGGSSVYRKAADNSWVELIGAFVTEGPISFTLTSGPVALMPLAKNQIRAAIEKAATQLRRVVRPAWILVWGAEPDLSLVSQFQAALLRDLQEVHRVFGQRVKGEVATPTVIMQLTRNTPWPASDADIETAIAAQAAVATALTNAAVVSTDKLPMEISQPPVFPRTQRQHNGVHHTARGSIMAGYLADAAFGDLEGIPDHPDGSAALDFGAEGGAGDTDEGTDGEGTDDAQGGGTDGGVEPTAAQQTELQDALFGAQGVKRYRTPGGLEVEQFDAEDSIARLEYARQQAARRSGLWQTVARFD